MPAKNTKKTEKETKDSKKVDKEEEEDEVEEVEEKDNKKKSTKGVRKQKKVKKPSDPNKRIAKEYCSLDASNIISGSRRRANVNYRQSHLRGEKQTIQRESHNTHERRAEAAANLVPKRHRKKKDEEGTEKKEKKTTKKETKSTKKEETA
ncbi:hypothetical protein ABK040_016454 [Willaertia magna]